MEIELKAEAQGHQILWTPPRYSDLQRIELVWGFVKGRVRRLCKKGTTLSGVRSRLDQEFFNYLRLKRKSLIRSIISSVDKVIHKFESEIEVEERNEEISSNIVGSSISDGDDATTNTDLEQSRLLISYGHVT